MMYYYFDALINSTDIDFNDHLLDQKLHENISVYGISYETSAGPKPLHIRFNNIDGFIRDFNSII